MSRPEHAPPAPADAAAERPSVTTSAPGAQRARRPGRDAAPELVAAPPRRQTLWASLTYALATLLLGFPALAGRFLVSPTSDQYLAGYAFREFTASWLRSHGAMPLWNPYLMAGVPHVAAMAGDLFYPTTLLRLILPTDVAMTWSFLLHVFLAGLFTYLFLRAAGLGFFGALLGGLAYMMGGNVAGLVSPGHDGKLFVSALLPLALLLVHRGVRGGRAWAWGTLVVAITLAVLTPHPQLLQYLLLVTGAYAIFCALSADPMTGTALPRPVAIRRLVFAGAAVALGLLGGAIQFWPVLEYAPWSPRAGGKGWEHAISYSMPPEELVNTYLPQFSGILEQYSGRNGIHFHSEYIGAAVLVLAGLAFGAGKESRRFVWFWAGALLVATLWALGGYTPFYHLVYALVPGTKFFRAPSTMLYVVSFCTAVLAAVGTDRALAGRVRPRYAIAWLAVAGLVGVMAAAGMLTNLAASFAHPALAQLADANGPALTVGAWRSFLAVAAVAALLIAVLRGRVQPHVAAWALVGIVGLDLWSIVHRYWRFSPRAAQLYAADPIVNFLKVQSDSGRVVTVPLQEPEAPHDPFLTGDALMVHGIRQVLGYHGNELGRYQQLYGKDTWPQQLGNPNFWRLANIRFLLTNAPQLPIEGATKLLGPVRNAAGSTEYLFRLPGDNPPAWVAPIAVKAPDENVLATIADPRFDVRRAALLDTGAAIASQAVPPQLPAPLDLAVRVNRWEPGHIVLALDRPAPAGGTLVVSENFYPGWSARVDGRAAPVARADYSLIGVGLAEGARQVELSFASARYETGKAITFAVLAAGLLLGLGGVALERRGVSRG